MIGGALATIFAILYGIELKTRKQVQGELSKSSNKLYHADELIKELGESNSSLYEERLQMAENIEKLNKRIEQLTETNNEKREKLHELEKKMSGLDVKDEAVNLVKEELDKLHLQIKDEQAKLEGWRQEKSQLEKELEDVKGELDEWKNTMAVTRTLDLEEVATRNEELELDAEDERLIRLVDEVVEMVPELGKELKGVIWKKVWLPRMQKMCKNAGAWGTCGIYRLVRLEDGASYIGQAVDIKERWYQHAKKIVGVDDKGGEWVYKGVSRVDEFRWEVLEVVEDKRLLGEKERFWIDSLGDLNRI